MSETLDHVSKRAAVAEVLRREIFSNRLKPGSALRQEQIAARLGVSPTPVREAFRILEAEGYVESRVHRGVIVAERNYDDLIDAYEIRLALETLAVRRIINDVTPAVMTSLTDPLDRARRAMQRGDTLRFRQANASFHEALILASGSAVVRGVFGRLAASWFFFPQDQLKMEVQHKDHLDIVEALRQSDAERAVELSVRHVSDNLAVLEDARQRASLRNPAESPQ